MKNRIKILLIISILPLVSFMKPYAQTTEKQFISDSLTYETNIEELINLDLQNYFTFPLSVTEDEQASLEILTNIPLDHTTFAISYPNYFSEPTLKIEIGFDLSIEELQEINVYSEIDDQSLIPLSFETSLEDMMKINCFTNSFALKNPVVETALNYDLGLEVLLKLRLK
jgi:hypothetical protein